MDREVFISYSRKDLEEVKKIKYEIDKEVGIDCWMDLNGIESGSPRFTKDIVEGINKCKVFVFMLTESSQESEFALRELNYAYQKKKTQGKRVVIININNCRLTDEFEFMYGLTDTILWTNKPQHDKFIRDLINWTRKPLLEVTTEAGHLMEECQSISEATEQGLAFFAARNFTNLKIHGEMDARDFYFLKTFSTMLEYLDISDVKIKEFYGPYGTMHDFHSMAQLKDVQYDADEIPSGAFFYWIPKDEGMPTLREITLPEGIVRIRRNAFARAYNLTKINIPNGVTGLDRWCFCCCSSLKEIDIPETVAEIEREAFTDSPLQVVHSRAKQPPKLDCGGYGVFECAEIKGKNRTLYVPKGSQKAYEESDWATYFNKIIEE
jgi:hypothetical protein